MISSCPVKIIRPALQTETRTTKYRNTLCTDLKNTVNYVCVSWEGIDYTDERSKEFRRKLQRIRLNNILK